jgi:hypothetical protein
MAPSELCEITDYWEKTTGFNLEFGEYKAIYNQSVNTYYALKPSGGHKRKGPIANPWNPHSDDFDPVRGQLMKNPQATICSDAALLRIKEGIPVEKTIKVCRDIKQFITVIRASKGATWRGEYLGKTVRYYWGIDGSEVLEVEANAQGNFKKVPKSDGAVECMNLPEQFPGDIDYARYVQEAEDILWDVGFYGPRPEPIKAIRWTKANTRALTAAYSASLLT